MSEALVTRAVTCFRQWDFIRLWIDEDALFEPHVRWCLINDDPKDPAPPDLYARLVERGFDVLTPPFNLGVCGARNRALACAQTRWIDFVDGDDWPLPLSVDPLNEHVGAALMIYRFVLHELRGSNRVELNDWPFTADNTDDVTFIFDRAPNLDGRAAVALWNRQVLLELGGFDSRFDGAEDLHLAWKVDSGGLLFKHVPVAKQSYYWNNPAQSAVEWRRQGQLRLYLMLRGRLPPEKHAALDSLIVKYGALVADTGIKSLEKSLTDSGPSSPVSSIVAAEARGIFWRSRSLMNAATGGLPLGFRLKEAVKTLVGRV